MNIELLWTILALGLVLLSLPGSLELALLTLGGVLPYRPLRGDKKVQENPLNIAVVIPAHNEETGISTCVEGLQACAPGHGTFTIIVVADNCTDATAEKAATAGAQVLVREDNARRGKGYALDFAFRHLLPQGFDAFIVVDADARVESNFIAEFQRMFQAGAEAIQCRYRVDNPGISLRTRLMNVAWLAFNVLRPRGRERWGLSVGLLGNGFGLNRATVEAVPYNAGSVAEDLEYHLHLVRAGRRVRFADSTTVWSVVPITSQVAKTQRVRWEGGRFLMIGTLAWPLFCEVFKGHFRRLEPLLELLLLPLAFHVLLLIAALLPPVVWSRTYGLIGLTLVGLHVLAAIYVGRGGWKDLLALVVAPFYILWKLTLFKRLVKSAHHDAEWVRTERDNK